MINAIEESQLHDKENRRIGIDHLPERRDGKDPRRDDDETPASEKKK